GLQVAWTPQAQQLVRDRRIMVWVSAMPLADVLRAVTNPLELAWRIKDGTLHVLSEQQMLDTDLPLYRRLTGHRGLREAIVASPEDLLLTPAAYLELGNLDYESGKLAESLPWYERVIRAYTQSPLQLASAYNLGLAQNRLGHWGAALQAFYHVADQAP